MDIQVIPYIYYKNVKTGQKISKFSTFPDGNPDNWEMVNGGYTWGVTSHSGSYTEGLGRRPVETREEAEQIATQFN